MGDSAHREGMEDQEQKLERLEQRLEHLERELAEERASGVRRRQRERWLRIAVLALIVVVYLLYFRSISGFG